MQFVILVGSNAHRPLHVFRRSTAAMATVIVLTAAMKTTAVPLPVRHDFSFSAIYKVFIYQYSTYLLNR